MAEKKQGFLKSYIGKPLGIVKTIAVSIPSLVPFLKNKKQQLDEWSEVVREKLKNPALSNYSLGEKFFAEGKYGDAITRFKIACFMKKDYAQSHFMMARSYLFIGKFDKAVEQLKHAEEHQLNSTEFAYFRDVYLKDDFTSQPDQNLRKIYFDNIATVMDQYYVESFSYHGISKISDLFQQYSGINSKDILELGCGNGLLASDIKEKNHNLAITGLDNANNMINNAKLLKTINHPQESTILDLKNQVTTTEKEESVYDYLIKSDLVQYDSKEVQYDAVLARGIFNYIDDCNKVVSKVSKLLKSKGVFILYLRKPLEQDDYKDIRYDFSFPFFGNFIIHDEESFVKLCKKHSLKLLTKEDFTLEIKYHATALVFEKS